MRSKGYAGALPVMLVSARGATLVSIMLALALSATTLCAAARLVSQVNQFAAIIQAKTLLDEQMLLVTQTLKQELRRSGYSATTELSTTMNQIYGENPFAEEWMIGQFSDESTNSCVLFSYDKNMNGTLDNENPNEHMGLRLHNKALEIRVNDYDCEHGGWHDLTDSKQILITKLVFISMPDTPQLLSVSIAMQHAHFTQLHKQTSIMVELINV